MNQQTSCSLNASMLECKNKQISNSNAIVLHGKDFQGTPDVVELTRILIRTIVGENTRNMTQRERVVMSHITNKFISLIEDI